MGFDPVHAETVSQMQTLAMLAVDNVIDAASELARFRREGPVCNWPFGDHEVLTLLTEALAQACQIENVMLEEQTHQSFLDYRAGLNQLEAACRKFLSDHCGVSHINYVPRSGSEPDLADEDLPF